MNDKVVDLFGGDDDDDKERQPSKKKPKNLDNSNGTLASTKPFQQGEMITRKQRRKDQKKGLIAGGKTNENTKNEEEKSNPVDNIFRQAEKPFLIKTTNHEEETPFEIGLEVFIQREYSTEAKNRIEELDPEDDYGSTEYKLKLVNPTRERLEHLTTQMKFRLNEGHGEAKYVIGVEDDGTPTGLGMTEMLESLSIE